MATMKAWVQAIYGAALIVISVLVLILIFVVWEESQANRHQGFVQCERSRKFGPTTVAFYERKHVFTAAQAKEYRATIPRSCHE